MNFNQKVIIFDSPDGTGKTNIARVLGNVLGVPYFKMNTEHENWRKGRFKDALRFDQTYLLQFLRQTGYSVIIDRAYPAEWVYSKIYERETDDELLVELDHGFAELRTNVIVPLRRDYGLSRPDELVASNMLPKLHEAYLRFVGWTGCRTTVLYVDDCREDIGLELDRVVHGLDFRNGR